VRQPFTDIVGGEHRTQINIPRHGQPPERID